MDPSFDYIVVGGGTAGVVIASRLKEYLPDSRIALFEAGPNAVDHPAVNNVANPLNYMPLIKEGLFVDYSTMPQEHLDNRTIRNPAGRMLSGATAVNPGMWMRASAADLDMVAERAGNARFKYGNMLKYYKRTETDFESTTNEERYGSAGPVHTVGGRKYPLRDCLQQSAEKLGHKYNPNRGDPVGLGELTQCWRATSESTATRQHSAKVYDLSGVEVFCDSPVARILLDDSKQTTGVELTSGKRIMATKEVILSCGTQISPKILLLSGIGPAEELAKHNIPQLVDSPAVGQNLFDHIAMMTYYKFKDASKGYARPFDGHMKPEYGQGIPFEFVLFANIPDAELSPYLKDDDVSIPGFFDPVRNFTMRIFFKTFLSKKNAAISISMKKKTNGTKKSPKEKGVYTQDSKAQHWLLGANRSHYLNIVYYFAFLTNPVAYPTVKEDGCHFTVGAFNMLPLSRGTVTLKSADPNDNPVCDPQYLSNSADRFVMRRAVRESIRLLETDPLVSEVEGEVAPVGPNFSPLTTKSSDEEIDAQIRAFTGTIAHPMGTCALETVLDDEFRVNGVKGLRVCDASVFPEPIAAMPCCTVYALAEMCADLVAGGA